MRDRRFGSALVVEETREFISIFERHDAVTFLATGNDAGKGWSPLADPLSPPCHRILSRIKQRLSSAILALLERLNRRDMAASAHLFADDAVFRYFNPNFPDLEGDHVGPDGICAFFEANAEKSHGAFRIEPQTATPVGKELVVVHSQNTLTLEDRTIWIDVVVVWRIVEGRIVEE